MKQWQVLKTVFPEVLRTILILPIIGKPPKPGSIGLTNVIIPDSVTYIGDAAFMYCKRLENITIPNTVKYIGDVAFFACPSLVMYTVIYSICYSF